VPKFLYRVKKSPEEILEGSIEADSENMAVNKLMQLGYYPVWVEEEVKFSTRPFGPHSNNILRANPSTSLGINSASREDLRNLKVKAKDLSNFTRQLSDLLSSGLTLYNSLDVIEKQIEDYRLRLVIENIKNNIKDGKAFSETLKGYPAIFSNLYANLVKSGEEGGSLGEVLASIADFLEKEEDVRSRIMAALAYPILMAIVGFLTIFILIAFVVPKLTGMFIEMGEKLPLPTQILIYLSNFIKGYWVLFIIFILALIFLLKSSKSNAAAKNKIDRIKLRIPVFGNLVLKAELGRFSRTLSMLLKNGVPILHSLKITSDVIGNDIIKKQVESIYNDVRAGSSLVAAMKKNTSFPVFLINMTLVGEEGGSLDKTLSKASRVYEIEIDRIMKVITALLEPIFILIMGLVVGFIVISMLLPVFQISLTAH